MVYFTNCYAKMWTLDLSAKFPKARITTSEKDQQGEWINSTWFPTFLGDAAGKVKKLEGTERIKILKGKLTATSKKMDDGTFKNYTNMTIFDFELSTSQPSSSQEDDQEEESVEDELPF